MRVCSDVSCPNFVMRTVVRNMCFGVRPVWPQTPTNLPRQSEPRPKPYYNPKPPKPKPSLPVAPTKWGTEAQAALPRVSDAAPPRLRVGHRAAEPGFGVFDLPGSEALGEYWLVCMDWRKVWESEISPLASSSRLETACAPSSFPGVPARNGNIFWTAMPSHSSTIAAETGRLVHARRHMASLRSRDIGAAFAVAQQSYAHLAAAKGTPMQRILI